MRSSDPLGGEYIRWQFRRSSLYEGRRTSLIIFAVVNLVLGGVLGVALVAFDWWVRDYVLNNKTAFVGDSVASGAK